MEGTDLVSLGDGKGWPPGFRFHPTDEELVVYYLKRKMCRRKLKPDVIGETDVYKWDPEELPGVSRLKSRDRQWYFFSPRDRKYPNGARSNRATRQGYWKATGKDRIITCNSRAVGLKKTLVFYEGRAPSGKRTDWVMHEYTMDEEELQRCQTVKEYFALYKVYKKSGPGPKNGEQYGAPFREEEWLDDDDREEEEAECSKSRKKFDNTCSKDQNTSISQRNQLLDDFDDLLKNGVNNTLLEELNNEFPFPEQVDADRQEIGLPDSNQQCFDYTQLTNNLHEYSELTNTVTDIDQFQMAQEEPLEDYLEMNDLFDATDPAGGEIDGLSMLDLYHDAAMFIQDMGPDNSGMVFSSITDHVEDHADAEYVQQASSQPCLNHMNNEVANPNTHLLGSNLDSAELRNFFDSFSSQPCLNHMNNEVANPNAHLLASNLDSAELRNLFDSFPSQPCLSHMNNEVANPNAHLLASNLDSAEWRNFYSLSTNQLNDYETIEDQMWVHNQNLNVEETIIQQPPVSGVVNDENQNQNQNQNIERGNSWFSSAVWNFVDSIPSSPASAAESVMVTKRFERISSLGRLTSKRFERMSSFSRLTAKIRSNPDNVDEDCKNNNKKGKSKSRSRYNSWGMYYCFSLIGIIIAILCLSKNLLGSFLPFLA